MNDKMILEVGKYYRTRAGRKALITGSIGGLVNGSIETDTKGVITRAIWTDCGQLAENAGYGT